MTDRWPRTNRTSPLGSGDLAEVLDAIERCRQAQEAWKQRHPAEFRAWQREQADADSSEALRSYSQIGIPWETARELHCGVDDRGTPLVPQDWEERLVEATAEGCRLVLLCGLVGTGKTLGICRWLTYQDDGAYVTAGEVTALSSRYDGDRPRLESLQGAPALVVDELGMGDVRDADWGKLEDLLHTRSKEDRVTVCAINASPKEALDKLGERIARRVFRYGLRLVAGKVVCPGELRRQGRK